MSSYIVCRGEENKRKIKLQSLYWYDGPMDKNKMSKVEKKAFSTWTNQVNRCYRPNSVGYNHYGGKGIKVTYSAREFIGWYLEKISYFFGDKPQVGRIDHEKNYCFENIEIISKSENSREMLFRTGNKPNKARQKCVKVLDKSGVLVKKFDCISEAAVFLGVWASTVSRAMRDNRLLSCGYRVTGEVQ